MCSMIPLPPLFTVGPQGDVRTLPQVAPVSADLPPQLGLEFQQPVVDLCAVQVEQVSEILQLGQQEKCTSVSRGQECPMPLRCS